MEFVKSGPTLSELIHRFYTAKPTSRQEREQKLLECDEKNVMKSSKPMVPSKGRKSPPRKLRSETTKTNTIQHAQETNDKVALRNVIPSLSWDEECSGIAKQPENSCSVDRLNLRAEEFMQKHSASLNNDSISDQRHVAVSLEGINGCCTSSSSTHSFVPYCCDAMAADDYTTASSEHFGEDILTKWRLKHNILSKKLPVNTRENETTLKHSVIGESKNSHVTVNVSSTEQQTDEFQLSSDRDVIRQIKTLHDRLNLLNEKLCTIPPETESLNGAQCDRKTITMETFTQTHSECSVQTEHPTVADASVSPSAIVPLNTLKTSVSTSTLPSKELLIRPHVTGTSNVAEEASLTENLNRLSISSNVTSISDLCTEAQPLLHSGFECASPSKKNAQKQMKALLDVLPHDSVLPYDLSLAPQFLDILRNSEEPVSHSDDPYLQFLYNRKQHLLCSIGALTEDMQKWLQGTRS